MCNGCFVFVYLQVPEARLWPYTHRHRGYSLIGNTPSLVRVGGLTNHFHGGGDYRYRGIRHPPLGNYCHRQIL